MAILPVPRKIGFPCPIFIESLNCKYMCNGCDMGLRDPIQTIICGHRYCRCCHQELTGHSHQAFCKGCKKEESGNVPLEKTKIFPDKAIEREMYMLIVRCINSGCGWNGKLKVYVGHENICEHEMLTCIHKECGVSTKRKDLSDHLTNHCPMRSLVCDYCGGQIPQKYLQTHHAECDEYPIECTFCRATKLPRKQIKLHQDPARGNCPRKLKLCVYNAIGCDILMEEDKAIEHGQIYLLRHQDLLRTKVLELSPTMKGIEESKTFIQNLDEQFKKHEHLLKDLENSFLLLQEKLSHIQDDSSKYSTGKNTGHIEAALQLQVGRTEEMKSKCSVLETKLSTYEGVVAVLNGQIERDSRKIQTLEQQRRQDRELLETLERKLKAQDRIIALKDVALAEQDLRIQSLELASYDGSMVWKISDFARKFQEARSGKTTSVYSPCFYTSRTGYKMCARIYLYGDGMGKGNHVSLFFVIMKGPNDALLRWPFRQKVTLMWMDQNNREHVIDAFRPDPTSSSFQRPRNDMNIASGCPLFMPISQIDSSRHAYVKDDSAFLRIIVDTSDLN